MKKKLSSILMISSLAVAGIFGVSSALIGTNVNTFKEAKAWAAISSGKRLYVNLSDAIDTGDVSFTIQYGNSQPNNDNNQHELYSAGAAHWYYCDLENEASYFRILRKSADGKTIHNYSDNNIGFNWNSMTYPVIQWKNYGGDNQWYTAALPDNMYYKINGTGFDNGTAFTGFNTTTHMFETTVEVSANDKILIWGDLRGWNGSVTHTNYDIPCYNDKYKDIEASCSWPGSGTYNDAVQINNAGKYLVSIGVNFWNYGNKEYIWGSDDGSNIKSIFTVTKKYYVDDSEGSTIGTDEVASGRNWTAPSQSTFAGYNADAWLDSDKTTAIAVGGTKTISSDVTVYSKYTRALKNLYIRSYSDDWSMNPENYMSESVTFGDSYVNLVGTRTFSAGDAFKIANSDWSVEYGPANNDDNSKTFKSFLWESYPQGCFSETTIGGQRNYCCQIAGTYTFDINIYANGTYHINNVTREPSGTVTVTYKYILDGTEYTIGSKTLWKGYTYSAEDSMKHSAVFGYSSSTWYTQPIASNTYKFTDGTDINSNITLYQIYAKQEYKTYYFEVLNAYKTNSLWLNNVRVHAYEPDNSYAENSPYASNPVITPIYADTSSDGAIVYSAYLPVTAIVQLHTETAKHDTTQSVNINLSLAPTDSMCWRVSSLDETYKEWNGDWTQFEIGYSLVKSDDTLVSKMTSFEASKNLAAVYDVSLSENDNLNIKVDLSIGATASFNTKLYSLGSDSKTVACAEVTGSNKYFTMKGTSTFNFYLNDEHVIYIEDAAVLGEAGSLYVSNRMNWSNVYVYAFYSTDSATLGAWPGTRIDYIEDISSTVGLDYNGGGNIYKLLIAKLSGTSITKATSVILNDGTMPTRELSIAGTNRTGVYTFDSTLTTSPNYYVDCTGSSDTTLSSTTSSVPAPLLAYKVEEMIRNADGASSCNISKTNAESICEDYDDLTDDQQTEILNSTITTWSSVDKTSSTDWSMTDILGRINKIANDGKSRGTPYITRIGNLSIANPENLSTIIIIAASSVALLSVTALSILVIKKRKQKEE